MTQYTLDNLASTLKASTDQKDESEPSIDEFLTPAQWENIESLAETVPVFTGLMNHIKTNGSFWKDFMVSEAPYQYLENNNEWKGKL